MPCDILPLHIEFVAFCNIFLHLTHVRGLIHGTGKQRSERFEVRTQSREFGCWMVGCFGFNGPLGQYFSLYRTVSQKRERKRKERIDESKNVQTTPTCTSCKCSRPLPYCNQDCRTPRHWKFTQHHRTTRPPPREFGRNM